MVGRWSDLTAAQKTKGATILKAESNFRITDEDGELIDETDTVFVKRISEEWVYNMALRLHKRNESEKTRNDITSL